MRLAWLEPPSPTVQGDQVYRTWQPAYGLARQFGHHSLAGNWLQQPMHAAAETADVLWICQAVDIDLLALMQRRRRAGRTTIMELNDNFLEPKAFGDVGGFYHRPEQWSLAMQLGAEADALVLSTPYLKTIFGHLNDNAWVVPNSIDAIKRLPDSPQSRHFRLGWAGSAGHQADLNGLMPHLRSVLEQHPEVQLCIMAPAALHGLFSWVPKSRLHLRQATELEGYLDFISTWDAGLAPLLDTPFNRGRSDVKFLEYASRGVPAVVSKGPAYHAVQDGETALVANDPKDFVPAITALIGRPDLRAHLRTQAYMEVSTRRRLSGTCARLQELLSTLRGSKAQASPPKDARWLSRLTHNRETMARPRAAYLRFDEPEQRLFRAISNHSGGLPWEAHAAAARGQRPSFYMGHLVSGVLSGKLHKASAHLAQAANLAPQSAATVHHQLALALTEGQDEQVDAWVMEGAKAGADAYAPFWELAAAAYQRLGRPACRTKALQRALCANFRYSSPARALVAQAVQPKMATASSSEPAAAGQLHAAQLCLETNLDGPVWVWADAYWLARSYGAQQRWKESLTLLKQGLASAATQRDVSAQKLCLAAMAKAALALGDHAEARHYLLRCRNAGGPSSQQ